VRSCIAGNWTRAWLQRPRACRRATLHARWHAAHWVDRAGTVLARIALDGVPTAVAADGERVLVALRAD
jgi:hypothetical protein